jgi:hypothetical protein
MYYSQNPFICKNISPCTLISKVRFLGIQADSNQVTTTELTEKISETLSFTGMFIHYTPIYFEPYYVFTTKQKFLIKCIDCPKLIGELSPYDLLNIKGDVEEN